MDIKDFNFQISDLIPDHEYYIFSPNLAPLSRLSFKIKSNKRFNELEGWHKVDPSYIRGSVKSEICYHITSIIRANLTKCEIVDYIQFDRDDQSSLESLVYLLMDSNSKFAQMPPGDISGSIQDSNKFINSKSILNIPPYIIGNLGDMVIEVDPIFRHDDDIIYLFDSIEINIQNVEYSDGWEDHNLVDICKFEFGFKINNPRSIAVVCNNQSKHWGDWVKLNRNSKIDNINGKN